VLLNTRGDRTGGDIQVLDVARKSFRTLVGSRFEEGAGTFSPDGRYVAYVSDESGQPQVYVQPFPELDARTQVSTNGGVEPVWSPKGDALFYRAGGKMMTVDVALAPTFSAQRPRELFDDTFARRGSAGLADYDVSHDGQRLVMVRERQAQGGGEIRLVLDWFGELRAAEPQARDD